MNYQQENIVLSVKSALKEDVGDGDISATLLPIDSISKAKLISKERAVLCGTAWFNEVFQQLDPNVDVKWNVTDGELIVPNQTICWINGLSRHLLTGERTAINFLQTLSGTATLVREYVQIIKNYKAQILDTRKTIPGLRLAQKYAVTCGGGKNHRMGLYDAFLIKENHIKAKGGILQAINQAKQKKQLIEVEVENLDELKEALSVNPNRILLDNFSIEELKQAVLTANGKIKLEASGNVNKESIEEIAKTGIDYISVGALTKDVISIDFSLRFI